MKTLKFKVPARDADEFVQGVRATLAQLGLAGEYEDTSPPLMGEVTYEVVGVIPIDEEAAKAMARVMVSESGGISHNQIYGYPIDEDLARIGRVLVGVHTQAFGAAE